MEMGLEEHVLNILGCVTMGTGLRIEDEEDDDQNKSKQMLKQVTFHRPIVRVTMGGKYTDFYSFSY